MYVDISKKKEFATFLLISAKTAKVHETVDYIYMDHLFQLLRNLNSLAFSLIDNSVLYPILNISKLNV